MRESWFLKRANVARQGSALAVRQQAPRKSFVCHADRVHARADDKKDRNKSDENNSLTYCECFIYRDVTTRGQVCSWATQPLGSRADVKRSRDRSKQGMIHSSKYAVHSSRERERERERERNRHDEAETYYRGFRRDNGTPVASEESGRAARGEGKGRGADERGRRRRGASGTNRGASTQEGLGGLMKPWRNQENNDLPWSVQMGCQFTTGLTPGETRLTRGSPRITHHLTTRRHRGLTGTQKYLFSINSSKMANARLSRALPPPWINTITSRSRQGERAFSQTRHSSADPGLAATWLKKTDSRPLA